MKLYVKLLILMSFIVNLASAQNYAEQARSMKEAADVAAQKSFTKRNAFSGYFNSFRYYQKAGSKFKNERKELLSATSALLANERYFMNRDALVVDSLLDEAYDEFKDDIKNYLPLLESFVCKASGTEDKYAHSFGLFDRAIEIRKNNNLGKGIDYETLLRWYCSHFYNRKELSQDDKFYVYKELWEVYLSNKSDTTELDIKLLDSYHSVCGFKGHEDVKTMLSELKNTYITSHFGKDTDEYLKSQETLAMDYSSLVEIEKKKGIRSESAKKELAALLEVWMIKKNKDDIYDSNAASTFRSLLYCMLNTSKDTITARSLANEYKEKIARKLGTDCEVYATALDNCCYTYDMFDGEKIPVLKEKLAIEEKLYGKDDYRTKATSSSLSLLYFQNHQLGESIAITQSTTKNDDYLSLFTLATNYTSYGQFREANETYEKLLQMCEDNPNIKGMAGLSSILGSINNYNSLNDIDGMLNFGRRWSNNPIMTFDEQLYIFMNVIGMASLPGKSSKNVIDFADEFILDHPQQLTTPQIRAKVMESKASALYGMMRFDDAINVINSIISTSLANIDKSDLVRLHTDLETCYMAKKDFQSAINVNQRNMTLIKSVPGYETSAEYCSALVRACLCYDQISHYAQIMPLAKRILSLDNTQRHTLNPLATFEVNNFVALNYWLEASSVVTPLVHAYCFEKKYREAADYITSYVKDLEQTIKFSLSQLDSDKLVGQYNYLKTTADALNLIASKFPEDIVLAKTVFDYCLLTKQAYLTSEAQMRKQILESGNAALKEKFTALQNLRNTIQESVQAGVDVSALQEHQLQLETQIRNDSQLYGDFTRAMNLRWQDIQAALDPYSAVVEFVSYTNFPDKKPCLTALVLQEGWENPQIVPLCCEEELRKDDVLCGTSIYALVWQPILKRLNNVKKIYFSPDGIIYNLSIENARSEKGYLSDDYRFHRISSARQLVNKYTATGNDAILYGGIIYNLSTEDYAASNTPIGDKTIETHNVQRGAIDEIPYLSGTKQEVTMIQNTLRGNKMMSVSVHTAKDAVERSVKTINSQNTKILHIATHGFYNPSNVEGSNLIISALQKGVEDQTLSRSGLYMAGAQNYLNGDDIPEGADDGILTSKEISTLDLRGLDLVTLSACETGLGDITSDGVFGLQRGFKKAGANTILMSLWKVDDEATSKLMIEFYSNWIGKKMTKHDALEAAKKTVRETKGWEDPKFWAPFILLDGLD